MNAINQNTRKRASERERERERERVLQNTLGMNADSVDYL